MTNELIKILTDLMELMKDWNLRIVPAEKEFIDELRKINQRLIEELVKQEIPEIKTKV